MASEDAVPPNESDKFNLSTEEDDKPKKKRIVCCIHGEPCKKGKEEAARAKAKEEAARAKAKEDEARAKDEVNVEPPNRRARMEDKRMKKILRAIREGLQAAENEKVIKENSAKRSRKSKKSKKSKKAVKEVRVRSSRKEASRKRKERKSRKAKKGDSESTTSEQSVEASEKREKDPEKAQKEEALENITKEVKHDSPAKRVFLGIMGWKQAERTLIDSGKRIGLYFKFEKIRNIDVLEVTLPRFVIFCPYGSDAFTHYRIVHRVVKDRVEYLVEDGSAEAQTFKTLNAVARHYEKLSDGTNLVL